MREGRREGRSPTHCGLYNRSNAGEKPSNTVIGDW